MSLRALEPGGGGARTAHPEGLSAGSGGRLAAIVLLVGVLLAAAVACFGAVHLFFVLHARRLTVTLLGVGLYGLGFTLTVAGGLAGSWVVTAHVWAATALIPIGTVYVFWKALSDRVLTARGSGVAVLMWAGFAAVSAVVLRDTGMLRADMPSAFIALLMSATLVPLAAIALAPWSFSLLRHR